MANTARAKVKGRKGRIGKNKARIAAYYNSGQNLYNKARGLVHHLRRQEDDKARIALKVTLAAMSLAMQRRFEAIYRGT